MNKLPSFGRRGEWKLVGNIGVDAGLCWIGDPCYVLHTEEKNPTLGDNWGEFCTKLGEVYPTLKSFDYALGHEGLGVCVSTGRGDGEYPVFAFISEKRVAAVFIDFFGLTADEFDDDPEEEL